MKRGAFYQKSRITMHNRAMLILGVETSCDQTGLAHYDDEAGGLLAHAVH